jgi:hypothetical protein
MQFQNGSVAVVGRMPFTSHIYQRKGNQNNYLVSRWNDFIWFKAVTWILDECHSDEKTIFEKESFVALNVWPCSVF